MKLLPPSHQRRFSIRIGISVRYFDFILSPDRDEMKSSEEEMPSGLHDNDRANMTGTFQQRDHHTQNHSQLSGLKLLVCISRRHGKVTFEPRFPAAARD